MAKTPAIKGKNKSLMLPAAPMISLLVNPWINPTNMLSMLVIRMTKISCQRFTRANPVIKVKAKDPNKASNIGYAKEEVVAQPTQPVPPVQ